MAKKTQVIAKGDPGYRAQQEYTPAFLRVYDVVVLGAFCRVLWRCPASEVIADYERLVSRRHLEIGPGTGYFLDKARLPDDLDLTLADPNPAALDRAARRLARYSPTTVELDVRKPLPVSGPYESVGMNGVLHCLPGPIERKASAVQSVAAVLADDGVLFGGTIVVDAPAHATVSGARPVEQSARHLRKLKRHHAGYSVPVRSRVSGRRRAVARDGGGVHGSRAQVSSGSWRAPR